MVVFRIEMRDGQTVDLANTQQTDFARHFGTISALTRDAETKLGDVRYCPLFIRSFVQRLAAARPK